MATLLLAGLLLAAAPEMEVQTLDGKTVVGPVVALTAEQVVLETPDGRVTLDARTLQGLAAKDHVEGNSPAAPMEVRLTDGSELHARDYVCAKGQARITLADGEVVEVARDHVAWVRLQEASGSLADDWARILQSELTGDMLVVAKRAGVDYHRGVLQGVTAEHVEFQLDGETLPVPRAKAFGLVYYHAAGDALPESVARITDASGARWAAQSLVLGEKLQWTTPSGVTVARPPEQIATVTFAHGNVTYLSDLEPEAFQWTPYFPTRSNLPGRVALYALRADEGLQSKPLLVGGQSFTRGLALHSRSEVVYRLPDRFRRFQAVAGIDDAVRPRGDVRLVIRGDERTLLDAPVTGTDEPTVVDLDLAGVRRLTILVDFGAGLDVSDHLVLGEARLLK